MRPFSLLAAFLLFFTIHAQDTHGTAMDLTREAVRLMDQGAPDQAIVLLEQAIKIDPDAHIHMYELGYAYMVKEDYRNAAKYFKKSTAYADATDQCWQMYGNCLDMDGQADKAEKAYDEGLKKFPSSGRLYMEKGILRLNAKEYSESVALFEKGIEVDPTYPTNYHRATTMYLGSEEEIWGMLYGEIFMNLERNSPRTADISKLLYDTYRSEITYPTDSTASVSFSKNHTIVIDDNTTAETMKLPFALVVYEPTLAMACALEKQIDMESLDRIRTRFLDLYFANGHDKKYPNALFEYQRTVQQQGHLSAYNHWILMKGDEGAFDAWHQAHGTEWDAFVAWFKDNAMPIGPDNNFHRSQY